MPELGVNVDHVATIREARGIEIPDPVEAASRAEKNGADGIVVHLRKDRRHIQERDLRILRRTIKSRLNLEMAITDEMIDIAKEVKPDNVTFVPEERDEVTTEGGLDVKDNFSKVDDAISRFGSTNIQVSLFIDSDEDQINAASDAGADAIELHTGDYAETPPQSEERRTALRRLRRGAKIGEETDLRIFAGHGLNYRNVEPVASIDPVEELNIGHSMIARSVMVGIGKATRQMKKLIRSASE